MPGIPVAKRSVASIPSKFETTLLVGTGERNGFGNRSHRFRDPSTNTPGPGQYGAPAPAGVVVRDIKSCGSVSTKGYMGGLISSTDRFVAAARQADKDRAGPGPGSYASPDELTQARAGALTWAQRGVSSRGGVGLGETVPTQVYHQPKHFRGLEPTPGSEAPGPGTYAHGRTSRAGRGGTVDLRTVSSFTAAGPRFRPVNPKVMSQVCAMDETRNWLPILPHTA